MKNYVRLPVVRIPVGIPRTQGAFSNKVTPEIDGFTDKPIV